MKKNKEFERVIKRFISMVDQGKTSTLIYDGHKEIRLYAHNGSAVLLEKVYIEKA